VRREVEQACARLLRVERVDRHGDATQALYRRALLRRRKNPSSSSSDP
jgi:hypothetical protein